MKNFVMIAAALALFAGCGSVENRELVEERPVNVAAIDIDQANFKTYGAPVDFYNAEDINDVLAKAKEGETPATVVANIDNVCAKMGCWMTLEGPGGEPIRVRFTASEDCSEGFFVPRNAMGHKAVAKGTIVMKEIPEDWAKHYAEEGGATPEEVAAIVGPQKEYELVATGVMINNPDLLDPTVNGQ